MSKFPSLPDNPEMIEVLAAFPEGFEALCDYHDIILRGPSPLSVAERELIATYVSGLNQCDFCFGAHSAHAEAHGIDAEAFEKLITDPASAGVDEKLLPLLAYAKKLTLSPSGTTDEDAALVYEAGWNEQALFHAISVTGILNLMNRLVEGAGVTANAMLRETSRKRIEGDLDNPAPYADFARTVVARSKRGQV
ncbi:MAG: peroxidase-related enzyme [Sphingorhabdus sp.]